MDDRDLIEHEQYAYELRIVLPLARTYNEALAFSESIDMALFEVLAAIDGEITDAEIYTYDDCGSVL